MLLLDEYINNQKAIYEYFGYQEQWTVYPINDCRRYYWFIDVGIIRFFDTKEAYENNDGNHSYRYSILYGNTPKDSVYEKSDFTMVLVDTRTDDNKFLSIFDNSKKVPVKNDDDEEE